MLRSTLSMGFTLSSTLHAPLSMGSDTTVTDVVRFVVLYMVLPLSTNVVEGEFSELRLHGVLRRVMCNKLDQQVRQVTKWPAQRSVDSLGAGGIRCDLGPQARQ